MSAALMRQAREIGSLLERLGGERGELWAAHAAAVRARDTDAAAQVGLALITSAGRRHLDELLEVRGKVHADPDRVLLVTSRDHRTEWHGVIETGS